jgi:hypothetical protein
VDQVDFRRGFSAWPRISPANLARLDAGLTRLTLFLKIEKVSHSRNLPKTTSKGRVSEFEITCAALLHAPGSPALEVSVSEPINLA